MRYACAIRVPPVGWCRDKLARSDELWHGLVDAAWPDFAAAARLHPRWFAYPPAVSDDASELLSASEEKVRMLRVRLTPGEVVELHADSHAEEASAAHDHDISEAPEMEIDGDRVEDEAFNDESLSDDTEYVDDPQIDLLSA